MSVPTPTRHKRQASPPSSQVTPARMATPRSVSSYSNYTPTVTSGGGAQRLNVVTRVALEGKAQQGEEGASIKMYLKISLPLSSVTPGSTITLFPEENVKILSSQVHPLDNNSVPYNFSSTLSPLLHRGAKALNLPARSPETFGSAFSITQSRTNGSIAASSRSSKSEVNSEMVPPVDTQYTGHILVSGYNISYVLPKVFPGQSSDYDGEGYSRLSSRRPSIGERHAAHFMAAIDLLVPYVSRPPRSPYLLSIPTPRCLHNHIKLRIFPPSNASNSYASLSSIEDEGGSWDLTSDPHVSRSSNRLARSNSYQNFADDESSDSSTAGFSEGCGIQGTFPSAERIRIRWAKPSKSANIPGGGRDGRRRVGVKHVKGEMTCVVRGNVKGTEAGEAEGLLLDVEYSGTCSGVWFPGVATLLGMDIGLEAKGSDISWPEGFPPQWKVHGNKGYTGFDVGSSTVVPTQVNSRASSFESNPHAAQGNDTSQPPANNGLLPVPSQGSRPNSTSSTSLLRAPLPTTNVGDYSFEGTASTSSIPSNGSPFGTMSSIPSLSASIPNPTQPSNLKPPGLPITLHLNINDLLPPAKNIFTFTISGTILLTPKAALSRINGNQSRSSSPIGSKLENPDPIMLPKFTILAADSESTTTIVRNGLDAEKSVVEVYHPTRDIHQDAQAKKTVLQKNGFTKCGDEGGRIVVKCHDPFKKDAFVPVPSNRSQAPFSTSSSHSFARSILPTHLSGPLIIPVVEATVTPSLDEADIPLHYGVNLKLHVPVSKDSEWLEFGFAHGADSVDPIKGHNSKPPKLQLISATVDGVPVKVETTVSSKVASSGYGVGFEQLSGKEWVSWVKLHVASLQGGKVSVDYVVKESIDQERKNKGKGRAFDGNFEVLLPTFCLPVGKLDVSVHAPPDFQVSPLTSNLKSPAAMFNGQRFLHYSLDEFFYPHLSLKLRRQSRDLQDSSKLSSYFIFTWIMMLLAFLGIFHLTSGFHGSGPSFRECPGPPQLDWADVPTVTVTTTVYTSASTRSWSVDASTRITSPTETPSPESLPPLPIHTTTKTSRPAPPETRPTEKPQPTSTLPFILETESVSLKSPFTMPSLADYGLQVFNANFSFPWPTQDLSVVKEAYEQVARTIGIIWQFLRKAYHYPLEAP